MPIYHKPTAQTTAASNEIADHTSDAAKVKRTREQAYFNSYDFDAIEVLPYGDDDDDDDAENMHHHQHQQQHHQHQQHSYHNSTRQLPFNSKYSQQPNAPCLNGQINQKRLPNASSLSSKSNSSMPSSSNSSSRSSTSLAVYPAGMPLTKTQAHEQRNYLQRLGALFKKSEHSQTRDLNKQQSPRELVLDVRNCVSRTDENFLLPRAILKYPSSGNITNSMPLTEVATTALTATNTAANGKLQSAQNHFANVKQGNTGFVAATAAVNTVARNKKQSTSSTITTATTASLKLSADNNDDVGHDDHNQHDDHDDDDDLDEGIVVQSQASTATAAMANTKLRPSMLRIPTATTIISNSSNSSSAADLAQQQQSKSATAATAAHGRASSHQSHYSTDKSGSSGYYSSNVCSTYSLDDHIYCEPVIDIIELPPHVASSSQASKSAQKLQTKAKKVTTTSLALSMQRSGHQQQHQQQQPQPQQQQKNKSQSQVSTQDADNVDAGDAEKSGAPYSENLRILETSIENLDRHLKKCPSLSAQERIANFVQTTHSSYTADALPAQRLQHLPTIMEGGTLPDKQKQHSNNWPTVPDDDDSLLDIDLDSFLLVNERSSAHKQLSNVKQSGIDNPGFMQDVEDVADDNNYKCAKYINSCPEDAYRVESDIAEHTARMATTLKRYEEQLHFQNTRELLEDVRDKIRLLSRSRNELHGSGSASAAGDDDEEDVPKELEGMIKTLKHELEEYLQRMNQHSELEIRQLCSGISKNQHIVKMKNAFQRRQSLSHSNSLLTSEFAAYEAIRDGIVTTTTAATAAAAALDVGIGVRHQITTIRCASDPNFKMKRKSLTEVFPIADCYIETIADDIQQQQQHSCGSNSLNSMTQQITQLQRNLSFHKPLLSQLDAVLLHADAGQHVGGNKKQVTVSSSEDRDSLASWHRKKPSIWEMYYGTNRLNQTLLGKRGNNGVVVNSSSQATLSYPSSRPESDFTLDLPRAEQLRIKMEKEKKFRQRCRYITTFLSLIFFLLTVMVVSLVLTRGKRMFGSMI